jgi:hypothetical protein
LINKKNLTWLVPLGLLFRVEYTIAGHFFPKQIRPSAAVDRRERLRDLLILALHFHSLPRRTYVGFSNGGAAALGGSPGVRARRLMNTRATSVRLLTAASVLDLKAALRVCFPPTQATPVFHLFLRGGKLLNAKLASLSLTRGSSSPSTGKLLLDPMLASVSLARGEFISLIPFARLLPSPDGINGSGDKRFFL